MATSNIRVRIPCDIRRVWQVITEGENYTWRIDFCTYTARASLNHLI